MLARLEQGVVLAWLTALALAVGLPWHAGQPLKALWGGALVLCSHALWLLLTFSLMRWRNLDDPAPRASWAQWLSAWWGEVKAAPRVFGWRQPFRSNALADFLPEPASRGRTGVLLVHGFVCNRGLWNPWMARLRTAGVPHVAVTLEPVFGSIDEYPALIEAGVRQLELATGERPLLVGHSMGGLAIRAWLDRFHGDDRVAGVITLGSPHHGTWLAKLSRWTLNGAQMRPDGDWLRALAVREPRSRHELFLCLFSHCDNIVFPASTAVLEGARSKHVAACAHVDLVHHPEGWAALRDALGLPGEV
ncbi:MAG: alpha/beta fold hydrolase [Vitreoscilla sp.]|nr:alpha/beta fold hydrolase [Vitreoscilla sp.]